MMQFQYVKTRHGRKHSIDAERTFLRLPAPSGWENGQVENQVGLEAAPRRMEIRVAVAKSFSS